jgi:hypothetical protein
MEAAKQQANNRSKTGAEQVDEQAPQNLLNQPLRPEGARSQILFQ